MGFAPVNGGSNILAFHQGGDEGRTEGVAGACFFDHGDCFGFKPSAFALGADFATRFAVGNDTGFGADKTVLAFPDIITVKRNAGKSLGFLAIEKKDIDTGKKVFGFRRRKPVDFSLTGINGDFDLVAAGVVDEASEEFDISA